jgi:hypothetical protein
MSARPSAKQAGIRLNPVHASRVNGNEFEGSGSHDDVLLLRSAYQREVWQVFYKGGKYEAVMNGDIPAGAPIRLFPRRGYVEAHIGNQRIRFVRVHATTNYERIMAGLSL